MFFLFMFYIFITYMLFKHCGVLFHHNTIVGITVITRSNLTSYKYKLIIKNQCWKKFIVYYPQINNFLSCNISKIFFLAIFLNTFAKVSWNFKKYKFKNPKKEHFWKKCKRESCLISADNKKVFRYFYFFRLFQILQIL